MYCAYITTLKGLRKHSNADRLQCVEVFGQNVIVDLSYQEGQKVVFFPSDGQLSLEYATDNNLVRKKDENGNNIGGYMDAEKRNVTAIRLRGEKSEGLVLPVETLSKYTDISKLKDFDVIYTDTWVSMGDNTPLEAVKKVYMPYQVNQNLVDKSGAKIVMHCLPAHRGYEITDEVMDGSKSVVFDEAENRLHIHMAVLAKLINA